MAEDLKELIEKIQDEGVKAAEEKALKIETDAKRRADEIIALAEKESARMTSEAGERIKRMEEGAKASVKQAARDTMLSLKKEIASMLERLVAKHIHKSLSAEEMAKILLHTIRGCVGGERENMVISLKKDDLEKVEKVLFSELGSEAKKGITLKPSADIHGGFLISYDGGKSYFDFSDRALAEYLAGHLKPELGDILKEAASK